MSRSRMDWHWIILAIVLEATAVLAIGRGARADTTTITLDDFFDGRIGVREGGRDRLKAVVEQAEGCPIKVKYDQPPGNYWTRAADLGATTRRYEDIDRLLEGLGVRNSDDRYQIGRMEGTGLGSDKIEVSYSPKPDQDKPKLDVVWTPPKGKKVKPGDTITAELTARDDTTAAQTGIARLRVDVDVGGGLVAAPAHYPSPVPLQECGRENPVRTYEATYTVRPDPPPVVKLRANARDFAGNEIWDDAEFPTTDWHGTIKKTAKGGGHNHTVDVDFAFEIETGGTIKGRARGRVRTEEDQVPACTMLWTYSPSEFDIPLSGRRDGENFEIALEPGTLTATIRLAGPCAAGQASNTFPSHPNPAVYAETKYRIAARDGATNTVERSSGALPWGSNMRDTITIHQAKE